MDAVKTLTALHALTSSDFTLPRPRKVQLALDDSAKHCSITFCTPSTRIFKFLLFAVSVYDNYGMVKKS